MENRSTIFRILLAEFKSFSKHFYLKSDYIAVTIHIKIIQILRVKRPLILRCFSLLVKQSLMYISRYLSSIKFVILNSLVNTNNNIIIVRENIKIRFEILIYTLLCFYDIDFTNHNKTFDLMFIAYFVFSQQLSNKPYVTQYRYEIHLCCCAPKQIDLYLISCFSLIYFTKSIKSQLVELFNL